MRIHFMSDTHIELSKKLPKLPEHGEVLILAGDIGNPFQQLYEEFLRLASETYQRVYVIAGNHEYYGSSIMETDAQIQKICEQYPNVVFMQCGEDIYQGLRFLGCTLWSDVEDRLIYKLNDFFCIHSLDNQRLRPKDVRTIHGQHVSWIETKLQEDPYTPTIIITHHAPDERMNGVYLGGPLNSGFSTNLPHLFKRPVLAWVNGHTHQTLRVNINGIPCVSNCMGYIGEGVKFNPNATITISNDMCNISM